METPATPTLPLRRIVAGKTQRARAACDRQCDAARSGAVAAGIGSHGSGREVASRRADAESAALFAPRRRRIPGATTEDPSALPSLPPAPPHLSPRPALPA